MDAHDKQSTKHQSAHMTILKPYGLFTDGALQNSPDSINMQYCDFIDVLLTAAGAV